jgi:methionyl-tRNA formyltransferase
MINRDMIAGICCSARHFQRRVNVENQVLKSCLRGVICSVRPHHRLIPLAQSRHFSTAGPRDPIRVLFCGSDAISISSLARLHVESQNFDRKIQSIDVVCRPSKPTGRGLKKIRHPPIKEAAANLGLPVHQIDTFTGWNLPRYADSRQPDIDLIITVSFGLLVPSRLLSAARYGGINVHPSLLPRHRGPAPLHHIIANGDKRTGVTLQSMHPKHFDAGVILDQTPFPGEEIEESITYPELEDMAGSRCSSMLENAIHKQLYMPAYVESCRVCGTESPYPESYAPKITRETRYVDFHKMSIRKILQMSRAFGRLWASAVPKERKASIPMIFQSGLYDAREQSGGPLVGSPIRSIPSGTPYVCWDKEEVRTNDVRLMINTIDGQTLVAPEIKLGGGRLLSAATAAFNSGLFIGPHESEDKIIYQLYRPLRSLGDVPQQELRMN